MKEIQLTQGQVALVDDADYEWLNQYKWYAFKGRTSYYAVRSIWMKERRRTKSIFMHRDILGIHHADHIDLNGLNNQRSNLREATRSQQAANRRSLKKTTSKYKGVCWSKISSKWAARIGFNGSRHHLGFFETETEAAKAYNEKAIKLHGEFAQLNKIA